MKITKRQLKRIIKEERVKILKEASRDRITVEGKLLGDLMALGEELNATIDELDAWREKLTTHFESMDPENNQSEGGPPATTSRASSSWVPPSSTRGME
jgi:hypothetical protein